MKLSSMVSTYDYFKMIVELYISDIIFDSHHSDYVSVIKMRFAVVDLRLEQLSTTYTTEKRFH